MPTPMPTPMPMFGPMPGCPYAPYPRPPPSPTTSSPAAVPPLTVSRNTAGLNSVAFPVRAFLLGRGFEAPVLSSAFFFEAPASLEDAVSPFFLAAAVPPLAAAALASLSAAFRAASGFASSVWISCKNASRSAIVPGGWHRRRTPSSLRATARPGSTFPVHSTQPVIV